MHGGEIWAMKMMGELETIDDRMNGRTDMKLIKKITYKNLLIRLDSWFIRDSVFYDENGPKQTADFTTKIASR